MPSVENVSNLFSVISINQISVEFFDATTGLSTLITPKENRVVIFTSGEENLVHFKPVTKGYMSYFIFHFTCDERRNVADPKNKELTKYLPFGALEVPRATLEQYESENFEEGTRRL